MGAGVGVSVEVSDFQGLVSVSLLWHGRGGHHPDDSWSQRGHPLRTPAPLAARRNPGGASHAVTCASEHLGPLVRGLRGQAAPAQAQPSPRADQAPLKGKVCLARSPAGSRC